MRRNAIPSTTNHRTFFIWYLLYKLNYYCPDVISISLTRLVFGNIKYSFFWELWKFERHLSSYHHYHYYHFRIYFLSNNVLNSYSFYTDFSLKLLSEIELRLLRIFGGHARQLYTSSWELNSRTERGIKQFILPHKCAKFRVNAGYEAD